MFSHLLLHRGHNRPNILVACSTPLPCKKKSGAIGKRSTTEWGGYSPPYFLPLFLFLCQVMMSRGLTRKENKPCLFCCLRLMSCHVSFVISPLRTPALAPKRTFDRGMLPQVIGRTPWRVLGVLRQPIHKLIHSFRDRLHVLLAVLVLSCGK